ncbi:hypothetical protein [Coleofasciculus sp. FACHB-1120]|uniref:hypothetical protein n=1 Tax=Coleofasciculus sp. FACHB-1120 TaxID=2692783 RepID=UPI001682A6DD|nr:hypothetical protein [Coleofasciculus sp. FACHB-1120]MBD2740267.1 hypothetical protein [Coleofasciculus sp. FACHB-1120]
MRVATYALTDATTDIDAIAIVLQVYQRMPIHVAGDTLAIFCLLSCEQSWESLMASITREKLVLDMRSSAPALNK